MRALLSWVKRVFGRKTAQLPQIEPIQDAHIERVAPPPMAVPAEPIKHSPARREALRIAKLRRQIAGQANDLLDRLANLTYASLGAESYHKRDAEIALASLMDADFYFPHFSDAMAGGRSWLILAPEGDERDLAEIAWPIDHGMALYHEDEAAWNFVRVRSIDSKTL